MDICQVAAEGAYFHLLPTRVTFDVARVPFARCDPPRHHPAVGLRRKLSPDPTRREDHGLRFCSVGLQSDPLEQVDKKIQRYLGVCVLGHRLREGRLSHAIPIASGPPR